MACVDGAMPADKPTDDKVIIQCRPCKKAGLVINASKYCQPCKEYMCESCATIHRRFQQLEHHDVVPVSNVPSPGQSCTTKLPMRFCNEHPDRHIDWYCDVHEAMLCDTCKRTKHRQCQATTISEMTKVSSATELLTRAAHSMSALHHSIMTLKNERKKSAEALKSLEKSLVVDVKKLKTRLVEIVERLEAEILADIDKFVATETDIILEHVKTCDDLIPQLETALGVADEAKEVGDGVTSVIATLNLSNALKEFEPTMFHLQQEIYSIDISFEPSRILTYMLAEVDRLGTLKTARIGTTDTPHVRLSTPSCLPVSPAPSRTSWPDMNVESSVDINVPSNDISGSAIMPDGRIVLADFSNHQIILLDVNFNIQSTLKLPSPPWDVAVDGTNDVIVSIPLSKQLLSKHLQWIHVTNDLRAGRVVTPGLGCWGIAEIRSIGLNASGKGMFADLHYITVSAGGRVFVSDRYQNRITCFTNGGDVVYDVKCNKNISSPRGLLVDEDDNLLVSCNVSNDVRVLKKDGTFTNAILTSADGVKCPQSVSYRHSDKTLILTMCNTPPCRAYKLK